MKAPDRFATARLVLLQPRGADAEAIFERYAGDPEVTRLLGWPRHRSIADTEAFLKISAEAWERWPAGPYLIRSRETNELLGSTGFEFHTPHQAATGYVTGQGRVVERVRDGSTSSHRRPSTWTGSDTVERALPPLARRIATGAREVWLRPGRAGHATSRVPEPRAGHQAGRAALQS